MFLSDDWRLQVSDTRVVTGAGDGSLVVVDRAETGEWVVTARLTDNREGITHLDGDGRWLVGGTRGSVRLWDLQTPALTEHRVRCKVISVTE